MNVHLNQEFIFVTFFSSHFDGFVVADFKIRLFNIFELVQETMTFSEFFFLYSFEID